MGLDGIGQWPTGLVGTLDHLPVVAVTGPVVQLIVVSNRRPISQGRRFNDGAGSLDVALLRCKGIQNGADLPRMNAPHALAGVDLPTPPPSSWAARVAAARKASESVNSVTTQWDGTLPWAWQAAAISSLARTTSGWVN